MDYILRIKLKSPLTSSTGEGRVGWVDRDIAFNELGLPILPGRRLKGLWREAYSDLFDAWTSCEKSLMPVETIFGKAGSAPVPGEIGIHVGDALINKASTVEPWLFYLQDPKDPKLFQEDVVQHYANARKQTSINRFTGSADENTFRLSRTLQSDLVFKAHITFEKQPNDAIIRALAISAAALQYMGLSRTRGLGHIQCSLLSPKDGNNKRENLTKNALEELKDELSSGKLLPSIVFNDTAENNQISGSEKISTVNDIENVDSAFEQTQISKSNMDTNASCSVDSSDNNNAIHLLRYRLILKEPVVIPSTAGDPNTVVGRHEITGSSVWGAAARIYLNQENQFSHDPEFRQAFLENGLTFLTAYAESLDADKRTIPIPHSIRELKKVKERVVDFSESSEEFGNKPIRRLGQRYGDISQYNLKTQAVKTERNSHHARVPDNRRIGRALGQEDGGGNIFQYEAIQAGQTFQGAVLGTKLELINLQKWLNHGTVLKIGRSLSAQYGLVEFQWIDKEVPKKYNELVEWDGFLTETPIPILGKRLIITTLSPLMSVNKCGHPDLSFPKHQLANVLGMKSDDLVLKASYTRSEIVGGYHSHLRLPRQQFPAIASGSVFVFESSSEFEEKDREMLEKLEQEGLGLRKGEGFGRIAVNRQANLSLMTEERLDDINKQNKRKTPDVKVPDKVKDILEDIVLRRFIIEMKILGYQTTEKIVEQIPQKSIPSNTLIGRLRLILQRSNFKDSSSHFFKIADEKLSKHPIDIKISELDSTLNMYSLLKKFWDNKDTIIEKLLEKNTREFIGKAHKDLTQVIIKDVVDKESEELCVIFFRYLLIALHRSS